MDHRRRLRPLSGPYAALPGAVDADHAGEGHARLGSGLGAGGWGLERGAGQCFAWHWGANDGVANLFVVDLASGAALVLLTNGDAGRRVYERAAGTVFAREFDAFAWLQ